MNKGGYALDTFKTDVALDFKRKQKNGKTTIFGELIGSLYKCISNIKKKTLISLISTQYKEISSLPFIKKI